MRGAYDPRSFWDGRFLEYGHTGEGDPVLYAYDQPRRIQAVDHVLRRGGVRVSAHTRILDFGCGTGDFVESMLRRGGPRITAVDVSEPTIEHARGRFSNRPEITFVKGGLEEVEELVGIFDLVLGINVLQHIPDGEAFTSTIDALVCAARPGGRLLVMDFSPVRVESRSPSDAIVIRPRQEYIDVFRERGCSLVLEYGLPRIGVRLYRRDISRLAFWRGKEVPSPGGKAAPSPEPEGRRKASLELLLKKAMLVAAAPLDHILAPFPAPWTDMRILLFRKGSP